MSLSTSLRSRRSRRHLLVGALTALVLAIAVVLIRWESPEERFRDRASTVCRQSKHDVDVAYGAQLSGSPSPAQVAVFIERVLVPELRDRLARLRALDGGGDVRRRLAPVLDDYAAVVERLGADPAAAVTVDDPFAAVDARLDDLGLAACGSDPPS